MSMIETKQVNSVGCLGSNSEKLNLLTKHWWFTLTLSQCLTSSAWLLTNKKFTLI